MKSCSKCKVEKPLDEFYRQRAAKDGLTPWCKQCSKNNAKKNYTDNAESRREQKRGYRCTNYDTINERRRTHYAENKDTILTAQREVYATSAHRRESMYQKSRRRRARIAAAVPQRWQKSECSEQLCYWCGVDLTTVETHVEHLMPISLGGEAKSYNEAPACKECNLSKGDKHPLVWLARMF